VPHPGVSQSISYDNLLSVLRNADRQLHCNGGDAIYRFIFSFIDFREMPGSEYRAVIFKKSIGARNRGGIGLSYRPARLHRLAEFIPWNQFRGPINI
jgi:hypothetical protein